MSKKTKRLLRRAVAPLWALLGLLVPKDPVRIVINAFPDFDDTTRAVVGALLGSGRKLAVLTTRAGAVAPKWLSEADVEIAPRYSVRGLWLYHRARWVLFTHGLFSAWKPSGRQTVVNVWHGMPMKKIGVLDGKPLEEIPKFHVTIATDARFQSIIAAAFAVPEQQVLISEHPRSDVLRAGTPKIRDRVASGRRLAVWLPTYRASIVGDVRVDGDESASIFAGGVDLSRVDALCAEHRVLCLVKPHPMASVDRDALNRYSALQLVDEEWLCREGTSLYEVLGASDVLITDVSSVYFDYRVLGRPVVLFCPDLRQYTASRGFVAPIETLVSDNVIENEQELLERLRQVFAQPIVEERNEDSQFRVTKELLRRVGAL